MAQLAYSFSIPVAVEGLTTAAAAACFWLEDDGCGGHEKGNDDGYDRSKIIPHTHM